MKNNKISCSTFKNQEKVIKKIKDKINNTTDIQEKKMFASELEKEIEILLNCEDYKESSSDCQKCHLYANLNEKVIVLIEQASKLT